MKNHKIALDRTQLLGFDKVASENRGDAAQALSDSKLGTKIGNKPRVVRARAPKIGQKPTIGLKPSGSPSKRLA